MRISSVKSGLAGARARSSAAFALALFALAPACQHDAAGPNGGGGTRLTPGGSGGTGGAGSGGRSASNGGTEDLGPPPSAAGSGDAVPCNTWPALCDRRYDEIVYPTTHAAMANASPPWDYPAQRFSLHQQLRDGIRALMLEVHELEGELALCLGDCAEGHVPFASGLGEVAMFLAENPREIVTLLVDNRTSTDRLAAAFDAADLGEFLHFQASGDSWPTLGAMIDEGRRLVVFASNAGSAPEGILSFEDFFTSTRDDYATADDLECELPRSSAEKPLFLVNHFVSEPSRTAGAGGSGNGGAGGNDSEESASVGHALPDVAAAINENPFLIRRLRGCVATNARKPTFVAVDFYDVGAVLPATQELNELIPPTDQ